MNPNGGHLWEANMRTLKTRQDLSPHEDEDEDRKMRIILKRKRIIEREK